MDNYTAIAKPKADSETFYGGEFITLSKDSLIVTGQTKKSLRLSFKGIDLGLHKGRVTNECKPK